MRVFMKCVLYSNLGTKIITLTYVKNNYFTEEDFGRCRLASVGNYLVVFNLNLKASGELTTATTDFTKIGTFTAFKGFYGMALTNVCPQVPQSLLKPIVLQIDNGNILFHAPNGLTPQTFYRCTVTIPCVIE